MWNEILIGLQHVRTIAHRRQVLDLLPKDLTRFDRPSSTGTAEDLDKNGVDRKPKPTLRFFLAMNVQNSSISMKEQASVCGGLARSDWAAWTN